MMSAGAVACPSLLSVTGSGATASGVTPSGLTSRPVGHPGTGKGTFAAPHGPIAQGWNAFDTIVAAGDMNGDGHPDVIAREPTGSLLLYEGDGAGGWNAATQITGLPLAPTLPASMYPILIGAGDFDGDNQTDLAAIDATIAWAGTLWSYPGDRSGALGTARTRIGGGWDPSDLDVVVR
jgi:hypothetical protein